jgi:aspartyl-tRNA(Asn)/glutamyl-tRNA(Gln) amidotransferase subunit A
MTVAEWMKLFKAKKASPVEAVQHSLEQIRQLNPVLNAFCFVDEQSALADARASEQRWQHGTPRSVLDGVPVGIKDLLLTQGWPTLKGSCAVDPNQLWNEDAPVVAQLRSAGAVLVGKTTTSEFGSKITTDSLLNGITRNPWNTKYTSGGSSGGSAVAVCADMVSLTIGTDYMGSIRTPAAFCGVVGFKPTQDLLPNNNFSMFECGCVGPLAQTVNDVALFLGTKLSQTNLSNLRIAYCPDLGFAKNINHEIVDMTEQVATALAQAGAQVDRISKVVDDPRLVISSMYLIDVYHHWNQLTESQKQLTDQSYQYWALQSLTLQQSIDQIKIQQAELKQKMQTFMLSYDIILTPSTAVAADAFWADNTMFDPTKLSTDYVPFGYLLNLTHQPAITVPVGLNRLGMPVGVQLAGAVGADALVLSVAQAVESAFPMPDCPVIL